MILQVTPAQGAPMEGSNQMAPSAHLKPTLPEKPFADSTLLVVDDDPDIRESLSTFFRHAFPGLRVLLAKDAIEALDLAKHARIDIVLADYRMPGLDGLALLKELKNLRPQVPRILMTAYPKIEIAAETINESIAAGFFPKPLDVERVREMVSRLLAKRGGGFGRIPPWR